MAELLQASPTSSQLSESDKSPQTNNSAPPPPPAPAAPPPPPCPPPPPAKIPNAPIPPPPAGFMQAPDGAMTIKRKVQTKYKLPTINWIALKPNQVRGTIFNELDDDRLYSCIDFNDFEERFKIGSVGAVTNGESDIDGLTTFPSKRFKKPENVTLLEHTRLRNIGEFLAFYSIIVINRNSFY